MEKKVNLSLDIAQKNLEVLCTFKENEDPLTNEAGELTKDTRVYLKSWRRSLIAGFDPNVIVQTFAVTSPVISNLFYQAIKNLKVLITTYENKVKDNNRKWVWNYANKKQKTVNILKALYEKLILEFPEPPKTTKHIFINEKGRRFVKGPLQAQISSVRDQLKKTNSVYFVRSEEEVVIADQPRRDPVKIEPRKSVEITPSITRPDLYKELTKSLSYRRLRME